MTETRLPSEIHNLKFSKTVQNWDEAIPLGNGQCGALIWGGSRHLRFSLDRGDIWDTTPYPGVLSEEFTYQNMVRLAGEKNEEEIRRIFSSTYDHVLPTKLPAGKIIFDLKCEENVSSCLDLAHAEAEIRVRDIYIRSFLHAEEKVGYIEVSLPENEFSFELKNPEYGIKEGDGPAAEEGQIDSLETGSLKMLHYEKPVCVSEENARWFTQKINEAFSYGVFLKVREEQGKTLIVFRIADSNDGPQWQENAWKILDMALEKGYDGGFVSHCGWWAKFWSKSSISLPDKEFERNWYLTNYFLGSCSRKGSLPMSLQGVWTADNGKLPPWKGDYHHDLNTQMSYYSYLKANHREEGEAFIDYLWSLADCARAFARKFYDSEGLCLPAVMAVDGTPLGGWGMYSLSPTNQLWLCQAFERHYRFYGDREFLRERAYPYMKETAEFILGILEERGGLYYLPVSSSSEIHDDNIEAFLTPNSNYDLALMRYLFGALIRLARELENGEEDRWRSVLEKLPQLAVNEKYVLKLSPDEDLEESHRHFSHAMAIHPLRLIDYSTEENRKIIDATILDLERLGSGYWVGFSFTWMAELYAIQKNGNGAAYQLGVFWKNCCSQNGFHLNGDYKKRGVSTFHYRPFTLEANFCAADALQEMLLQGENNVLELFPAIPEEWQEEAVSFEDFCVEKGLRVSAKREGGRVTLLILKPEYDCAIRINNYAEMKDLSGDAAVKQDGDTALIELTGGKEYSFHI